MNSVERASLVAMAAELGWLKALWLGLVVKWRVARGEPFGQLPPSGSEAEAQSRAQIAPAIVLYRQIRARLGAQRSLQVTEQVVVAGAVRFLQQSIGALGPATLKAMEPGAREAYVKERGARFFNATMRWDEISDQAVRFTVTACRFPVLCQAVGVPELAPVFCRGDAVFFGSVQEDVVLTRSQTIAEGAETCPFALRVRAE